MDIVKSYFSRSRHTFAVFGALFALVAATLLPTLASAAALTERSIQLSSSTAGAKSVTYTVNFTATTAATAFTVEFCSNSSLPSDACTAPAGFDATTAASTTTGFTTVTGSTNSITDTGTIAAAANISVAFTGINNPSAAGTLYARINTTGGDNGGVAMNINDGLNVSGSVMESMTFCASGTSLAAAGGQSCTGATDPSLKLGQVVGSTVALDANHISTGTVYTQLSTNAQHGAVISIKSGSLTCGGLLLAGDSTDCYIPATNVTDLAIGTAGIGLKTGTSAATAGVTGTTGTLEPVTASGYNSTTYRLNYAANNSTGVTSTYGDPILDTASAPANSMNMPLTFGAAVSNTTPAGNYSADYSMIATGTF